MADLVSADVTYTISARKMAGRQKIHELTISFGDGAKTYPAGGVPLTLAGLGFERNADELVILDADANGFRYEWDKSANKIRILRQNLRTGSTAAADSASGALIENSNDAETTARLMGSAIDTDYDAGKGKEAAAASHTPPATVLTCVARGW